MAPLTYTLLDIISDALIEIGILAPGDQLDAETGQWAFRKANYLIDTWSAEFGKVFTTTFQLFNLVPNLSPHTIGPAGNVPAPTFALNSPRPVRIESAALILNTSGQLVDLPMNIRDDAWWAQQRTKDIKTNVPTDLFYSADSPLGSCFFWPVPNVANQVRLQLRTMLAQYEQINDPLAGSGGATTLPVGYRNALMLTLAETLASGAARELSATLVASALAARAVIFGNNAKSPRTSTQDAGMPRAGRRADFNWATGGRPGGPPE